MINTKHTAILEGLKHINESTDAKLANNINTKKFDNLQKIVKAYGYHITVFDIYRFKPNTKFHVAIVIEPSKQADLMPYISFVDNKFYTHPRTMGDFDDIGIKTLVNYLNQANDLCNLLNIEIKHIEDYVIADEPTRG